MPPSSSQTALQAHTAPLYRSLCVPPLSFLLSLSKHRVEHLDGRCVWVERASGDAVGVLQSQLVPWIELHTSPSLCTRAAETPDSERSGHQGNEVLSKGYRLVFDHEFLFSSNVTDEQSVYCVLFQEQDQPVNFIPTLGFTFKQGGGSFKEVAR